MQPLNETLVVDYCQEPLDLATNQLMEDGQTSTPDEAVRTPSELSEDRYQLGTVFVRCGILVEAVYHFIQGLRLNPQDERGYYALAHLAARRGKRRMAHRVLKLGLRHVPDSWMLSHALAGLASVSLVSREQQKAQGALHARVLELLDDGLSFVVLSTLANAYQEGTPPSADLKVLEAEVLENLSLPQVSAALSAYKEALALEPGHEKAFNQMVLLLMRQDRPESPAEDTRGLESANEEASGAATPVFCLPLALA